MRMRTVYQYDAFKCVTDIHIHTQKLKPRFMCDSMPLTKAFTNNYKITMQFFCIHDYVWGTNLHTIQHTVLSAVKACLTSLGVRPSVSQLLACTVMSLPYKPYTSHGKKPHSRSLELASSSKCRPELLHS